ncbi:DUF106 domain-containing protein [Salinirubellus salinus]|uniref:DUF106 domain-containing protein n=1 Tax=Salinirubellus salinus TaxID=1364945 RepID=A0A9E7UCZ6_9EURY|nr:DUF106 domain-containing protein [Salinirubellus salinus]UWM56449.1 DUF106 domain-containing protein [Salinirubellus salinus]
MAQTAEKVESLVGSDGRMEEVLRHVLDRAEDGAVSFADVSDEVDSGEWGRVIERGLLVEDGDEYVVRDPAGVREALDAAVWKDRPSGSGATDLEPPEDDSSWSTYDKAAALGAVGLFAGYSITPVRNAIGNVMDVGLGFLDAALPFYVVILVLALFTGLYSTLLQSNLMNTEKMAYYQQKMKDLQNRRKEAQESGDEAELDRIQEEQMEAMGENLGMFKEQFRPMVWIMLLTIPVFLWMYWMILSPEQAVTPAQITMPLIGELNAVPDGVQGLKPDQGWRTQVIGPLEAWIVWYFVCSMGFNQIIRKSLNIQTTPDTS